MHLDDACEPLSCVQNLLLAPHYPSNKSDVRRKGRPTISLSKVINLLLQLTSQLACVSHLYHVVTITDVQLNATWQALGIQTQAAALAKSPVGSTHIEYVETICTCSNAAFLAVTDLRM